MFTPKKSFAVISLLVLASLLIAACTPPPTTGGTPVRETVVVTVPGSSSTVVVTATGAPEEPTAVPVVEPKTMVVCMAQEPESLYWYSSSALVKSAVLEAVYDGIIDSRGYQYQPVAVKALPEFGSGAEQVEVTVGDGDTVYDVATDSVVTLPATTTVTLNQLEGDPVVLEAGATDGKAVQLVVTWELVDGLMWEDGTPVTAADFVFAFEVGAAADTPVAKYNFERTASYEAVDEKTIRWTSLPGYTTGTYFIDMIATTGALPKHLYDGKMTPAEMIEDEQVNRDPLAYGPFTVEEWVAGDHITLKKNPTYWRAKEGLPKVDTLIYRFIPDTNALIAQLASGECDMGTQDAAFEGSLPLIKQFEDQQILSAQVVAGTVFEHLDFNALPVEDYTGFAAAVTNDDGSPIFANPEIRQGIAHCIDRQAIVDTATNGAGVIQHSYASADHPLYPGDDKVTVYDFSPEKGLALLEKNGWTDSDADGILDKGGQPFSFIHSTRTNPLRQKVTQIVQEQLKTNCMIETTIELIGSEYFADGPEGIVFGRKYDMGEFAWLTGVQPPCDQYITSQIPNAENGWGAANDVGYSNAEYDTVCTAAISALDEETKAAKHAEAMAIFTRDLPSLPLFARGKILVTRAGVTGVEMDPTANSELWNVENFDIP